MSTTSVDSARQIREQTEKRGIRWELAAAHPVITFLLITFAWSWILWLAVLPFQTQNRTLVLAVSLIGGYGPALGGIFTLGLKNGLSLSLPRGRRIVLAIVAVIIFGLFILEYLAGQFLGYGMLSGNVSLSLPVIVAALLASLLGGWVVSSARSGSLSVRAVMHSLLPTRLPLGWTLFALLFYPALVLASWAISALLGMEIEYPSLWGQSVLEVLPLFLLTFTLTALARGGMEEPGWRGVLQPILQNRFSPLIAALMVSVIWSLWHLPLYFNGFYTVDLATDMIGGSIFRVILAIFLAWVYLRTGSLLYMVILHTSFNMVVNFIPTSDLVLIILWLIVALAVVLVDKMYRKRPPLLKEEPVR